MSSSKSAYSKILSYTGVFLGLLIVNVAVTSSNKDSFVIAF